MEHSPTYKKRSFKNSYLLILAAWLATFSVIIDSYWSGNSSTGAVKKKIEQNIQRQEEDFAELLKDTVLSRQLDNNTLEEPALHRLTQKSYFIYRYFVNDIGIHRIIFWNTQTVIPSEAVINASDNIGFVKLDNGYYVWNRSQNSKNITIALIPVKWNYFVVNTYLENKFVAGEGIERNFDISTNSAGTSIKSMTGKTLFYLAEKATNTPPKNNRLAIWLSLLAALFTLMFIHLQAVKMAAVNFFKALSFLIPVVLGIRILSYFFPVPLNFRQFELFDPTIYGSSAILRSLGDLLINAVLFTWIVLFIHSRVYDKEAKPVVQYKYRWALLIIVSAVLLITTFTSGHIISSMVADSKISFDVINFFTLNIYSVAGFIVLCCIAIGYFLLSQVLLQLIRPYFSHNLVWFFLVLAVGGLIYLSVKLSISHAGFELAILTWLILYLFLLSRSYLSLPVDKINAAMLIFWLFFFSITITAIIVLENSQKEMSNRKFYAETLATKADPASETLLNSLLTDFRNDYLAANFYRFETDSSNLFFKDSLVNGNFSGYTNKYDTKVFTFDANENPLFNKENISFNELNTVLNTQAKPTNIPELFYYDESYDRFSYISRKTVTTDSGNVLGYVFVLANPKKYKTDALNLQLFSRGEENAIENSPVYAFAVYNKLKLVNIHNDYPFATSLSAADLPTEEFRIISKDAYDELWYKAGPQKVVIITKKNNLWLELITLFSYLFCAFLLVAGIFWLLNISIRARFNRSKIRYHWNLSIRNQIHGTVILISILSFFVIGIATILFFISRYENTNREKLSRVIHVMENQVRGSLTEMLQPGDNMNTEDGVFRKNLDEMIVKISEIHSVDVNLYDLDGNLQVSSLPLPYNMGVISNSMDPVAYYHLGNKKEVQFFKDEQIGKLRFLSNYVPVIDANGREYAYLNIPYFTSQSKLQEEIANFLVTIINLNAFIFLIAGIIALFITNRITRSFSFISEKMKAVNLGQQNEAIEWKRNDEIGELVKEYNKMVGKLDESAASLAKSEREGAWREMARQVAHEIKNPLTPMKLSLQYLQKSIAAKSANVEELTNNVASTLVEQIEHLNHIAGQFSQFANIGNPKNEVFDMNEVLKLVTQLHSVDDRIHINLNAGEGPVMIDADRTHINRLFTNLILNAMQAVPTERAVVIDIDETASDDTVLVKIKDNGNGIDADLQAKIFTPNFTTKTSGTGLGLAMCKGIVEQARGKIWFETAAGSGTTFFVELPLQS